MSLILSSLLMTVNFTKKIKLFRTFQTSSEKQPTTLVNNHKREVSEGKRREKIKC